MHHHIEGIDNHFRFWEFTFHANSFLYRQVGEHRLPSEFRQARNDVIFSEAAETVQ